MTTDVRGMLSFYESSQLRIKGESILDEAFAFTETKLKSLEKTLQDDLARQVKHALQRSFHRGHAMFEARQYLSNFEEEIATYDSLLTLAKVHFNYLQLLQKEELRTVSKWWKDMKLKVNTSYVRDRVPECYIWSLSLFLEPYYSQARIITTKGILLICVLDDTYDAYATIEEIRVLTHAINRWDITAMSQLPEYIKPFYDFILNEHAEWAKQIPQQGTTNLIEALKKACREVPSFEEYMRIGLITSGNDLLYKSALLGMGKIVTQEAFGWYESHPKIVAASELIGRLHDDVMTFGFERERSPSATGVDAYMKTFGVSENVAVEALQNIVEETWKDINEGCLKPREVPMDILAPIVNLARMVDVVYRYDDGFTFPEKTFKEYITLMLCVSVPIYGAAKGTSEKIDIKPYCDSNEKLSLIFSVSRLGLTYLFSNEIDGQLDKLFNQLNLQDYQEADLYTTSLHFQVFRSFGYKFSCDVFNKFKDFSSGEFKEDMTTDVRGMLSFYESSQLRIRGESILDEAFAFTETKLKTIGKELQGDLARQVKHALERSFHRGHAMFEARKYLSHFEEEIARYDSLLTLAKVHFNYLQLLQKEEVRTVSKWDITAMSQLPEYIKPFYEFLLDEYVEWDKQLPQQGTTNFTEASKKAFQEVATAYLEEAEWRESREVPSFEEHMRIGLITSGNDMMYKTALIGMGKIVT
ncbi:hypothetical protein L1987_51325 [Smallanthus sonchifolius]|uniref:Uncharacterized protein n=1 Tax=Smallanthus sonchifolius TaxID=185202 RepID=A0ACB9EQ13_9ASTR|nr:hypothetical protein L1987_51325 [Smallanthus sonchifolius]